MNKFNWSERGVIESVSVERDDRDSDCLYVCVTYGAPHPQKARLILNADKSAEEKSHLAALCKVFGAMDIKELKDKPCIVYWHGTDTGKNFDMIESVATGLTFEVYKEKKKFWSREVHPLQAKVREYENGIITCQAQIKSLEEKIQMYTNWITKTKELID